VSRIINDTAGLTYLLVCAWILTGAAIMITGDVRRTRLRRRIRRCAGPRCYCHPRLPDPAGMEAAEQRISEQLLTEIYDGLPMPGLDMPVTEQWPVRRP
jgi:hypothetical protein